MDELLSGVRAQLAIKLFGPDLDILAEKGQAIEALVKEVEGARDVAMEQIAGESQLIVTPNRRATHVSTLNICLDNNSPLYVITSDLRWTRSNRHFCNIS